jgi:cobalt-zinc-cadmium efflux system outer membrane protein
MAMRRRVVRIIGLTACLAWLATTDARAQQAASLTLRQYLDAVAQRNLDLQAQRESVTSAQAGVSIAGVRPDPQFTGGIDSKELYNPNKPNASTATVAGIAFTLETGGKRDARLRAARSNVRLSEANVEAFTRQLEADASGAFIEVCRAKATVARQEASLAAMREIVRTNEVRFKAGDIGRLELSQSRVEADRFQADVVSARAQGEASTLTLGTFLGEEGAQRLAGQPLDCAWQHKEVQANVDALVQHALEARDDVRQARAAVDNARDNVDLAHANRSVDPTVNVGLTNTPRVSPIFDPSGNLSNMPAERSLALNLTLSVPIPLSRLQHGELTQAESLLTQAQLQLRSTLLKAEADVRVAYTQFGATETNVRTYTERVLDESQRVLEGTRTSYRKGAASLLELLAAQRSADEVYTAYLQALAARANATVKLQQSTGARPEL